MMMIQMFSPAIFLLLNRSKILKLKCSINRFNNNKSNKTYHKTTVLTLSLQCINSVYSQNRTLLF